MGLISGLFDLIFGSNRNVIKDTVEVFRVNAEEDAERLQKLRVQAIEQFGLEFDSKNDGWFNRAMDGVNRIPRPALAIGTLALFIAAMVDPIWFAARMQGIALVPEPLWWLLGVIVSFYFGARHQIKNQQFQKSIAQSVAMTPKVASNIEALRKLSSDTPGVAGTRGDARLNHLSLQPEANLALEDWRSIKRPPATK